MLILKPNCELCDVDLSPASKEARICSYECTFCKKCVETVLDNVCPNCGGGFVNRPIRPKTERRIGVSVFYQKPSSERIHSKYSEEEIGDFVSSLKDIPPEHR